MAVTWDGAGYLTPPCNTITALLIGLSSLYCNNTSSYIAPMPSFPWAKRNSHTQQSACVRTCLPACLDECVPILAAAVDSRRGTECPFRGGDHASL